MVGETILVVNFLVSKKNLQGGPLVEVMDVGAHNFPLNGKKKWRTGVITGRFRPPCNCNLFCHQTKTLSFTYIVDVSPWKSLPPFKRMVVLF